MLTSLIFSLKYKAAYDLTFKEISPVVKMTKYISFYSYRPYLTESTNTGKLRAFCLMKLRGDYVAAFDYYIQNRITHELVYPFMLDADQNVEDPENNSNYADLPGHFEKYVKEGKSDDFTFDEIDRVRKVLAIIEQNEIDIHSVVSLSKKKLARRCVSDYHTYFDFIKRKKQSLASKYKIVFSVIAAVTFLYWLN